MKVIYFPGSSEKNKEEGIIITNALKEKGLDVYFNMWRHWETPIEDTTNEINQDIENIIQTQLVSEQDVFIIGKSLGSFTSVLLSLKLLSSPVNIKGVILLGVPFSGLSEQDKQQYLDVANKLKSKLTIIQNSQDPWGAFDSIKAFFSDSGINLIKKDAEDHKYVYPEDVLRVVVPKAF